MKIVDASVAVKWLFPERGSSEAQALLMEGGELTAPALVRIEVFAAITSKVRLGEITAEDARTACDLWSKALQSGVLALVREEEVLPAAVELALALAHPLQDCLYLAVAQREQGVLVTADPKFELRARTVYGSVQLLAGIS